ncbi:MAG: 30S ribosomal protein S4 [Planctomycetota bacterium]|nr:30S ribosomal protein S4 [Planctomycetota bacterium]
MGRYTGPKCKLARRIGMNLELKGKRLEAEKCRGLDIPPGGRFRRSKLSAYGEQLLEKQKLKWFYGVMEAQFRRYFHEAAKSKGSTGEALLLFFERRLDNVLFKLGWTLTRAQARQLIVHGHVNVGDRRCTIPSCRVSAGDVIRIRPAEKSQKYVRARIEESRGRMVPAWLSGDNENLTARVVNLPTREDVSLPVNEQLIVELLSK